MSLPSGFGEFSLDGSFEGSDERGHDKWWARLEDYYYHKIAPEQQKMLFDGNENISYVVYVVSKFSGELGVKSDSYHPTINAIAEHEPPVSFCLERGGKSIGSMVMLNSRILAVDETLKAIIEKLEPDVHQFFQIKIKRRNGEDYPNSYYTLVIGQYFDSFLPEQSEAFSFEKNGPMNYFHKENKAGVSGLAVSEAVFGNAHLWRERRMSFLLTCFSDKLIAEIIKAGLRIPKHYRMTEV